MNPLACHVTTTTAATTIVSAAAHRLNLPPSIVTYQAKTHLRLHSSWSTLYRTQ